MDFVKRLVYYLGGVGMGSIVVVFFLSGKKTSCNYLPNDRVVNHLVKQPIEFTKNVQESLRKNHVDTLGFYKMLSNASVDFSKSNPQAKDCKLYHLLLEDSSDQHKHYITNLKSCQNKVIVDSFEFLNPK